MLSKGSYLCQEEVGQKVREVNCGKIGERPRGLVKSLDYKFLSGSSVGLQKEDMVGKSNGQGFRPQGRWFYLLPYVVLSPGNQCHDSAGGLLATVWGAFDILHCRVMQPGKRRLWLLGDCPSNEGPEEGRHHRRFWGWSWDGEVEMRNSFGRKTTLVWTY